LLSIPHRNIDKNLKRLIIENFVFKHSYVNSDKNEVPTHLEIKIYDSMWLKK